MSSKKGEKVLKILLAVSVVLGIILVVINKLTTPTIYWAGLANCGIIYTWITVLYSIKKSTNVAGHVLLQTIISLQAILYIDYRIGFRGWSINIAIPIALMIANATMLILTIVTRKNYIKYAIYQLVIVCISIIQFIIAMNINVEFKILNIVSVGISLLNFVISLILSYKEFYKIIVCKCVIRNQ